MYHDIYVVMYPRRFFLQKIEVLWTFRRTYTMLESWYVRQNIVMQSFLQAIQ